MTKHNYNSSSRFWKGLAIYVLVFLIISAAGLIFVYDLLVAFENTQPAHAVGAYTEQLHNSGLAEDTISRLSGVDHDLQSDAEIKEVADVICKDASLIKSAIQSTGDRLAYQVRVGENIIGTVFFEAKGEKRLFFSSWVPTEENYDFSAYMEPVSLTVPEGYTVSVNGHTLSNDYIDERGIRYQTLADYYDEYRSLPTMINYAVNVLGEVDVNLYDRYGNLVSPGNQTESYYLDTADGSARNSVSDFAREFVSNYVQFTADVGGGHYIYYSKLLQMVTPESELLDRVTNSLGSFGFTTTSSCEIVVENFNIIFPISNNIYFVDYSYTTEVHSRGDSAQESRNVRLIIEQSVDQYLVREMTYY